MLDNIVRAIVLYLYDWWRVERNRAEFTQAIVDIRSLLDKLDESTLPDEVKNDILDKAIVSILLKRRRMRD